MSAKKWLSYLQAPPSRVIVVSCYWLRFCCVCVCVFLASNETRQTGWFSTRFFPLWPISSPSIVSITRSLHVLRWHCSNHQSRGAGKRETERKIWREQLNPFSMLILNEGKQGMKWKTTSNLHHYVFKTQPPREEKGKNSKISSFLRNYGFLLDRKKTHTHWTIKRLLHSLWSQKSCSGSFPTVWYPVIVHEMFTANNRATELNTNEHRWNGWTKKWTTKRKKNSGHQTTSTSMHFSV